MSKLKTKVAAALLLAACSSPPPPQPPPSPQAPKPTELEEARPPAPKPCEALDEACKADAETKARIGKSGMTFKPAVDWFFAQGENVTVAQVSDSGACLAMTAYETGKPTMAAANRDATFDVLSKQLALTTPKKKVPWSHPGDKIDVAGLKVAMWEVSGAKRGDKPGPLLVFEVPLEAGRALLGVGYVPDDDASNAENILGAVRSLSRTDEAAKAEATSGASAEKSGNP